MAEWLGKPYVTEEDVARSNPQLAKYFPMLLRYIVDDQRMRVTVVFPPEKAERLVAAIRKAYGAFGPTNVERAGVEAMDDWIAKQLGR